MDDTGTQLKYSKHSDDVSIGWKNMPMPLSGRAPQSQTLSDGLMERLSKVDFHDDHHLYIHHFHHLYLGHSGDFGNAAKMVGKMSKLVMQLISIGF